MFNFAATIMVKKGKTISNVLVEHYAAEGKCILPAASREEIRRRLGETVTSEEAAKIACADSGGRFEQCVYDVMAMGDLEAAQAGVL